MQRRIRIITWLLAACVVGINGFQAYWLYSTYQLTRTQWGRTVHETLVLAVQQHLTQVVEQTSIEELVARINARLQPAAPAASPAAIVAITRLRLYFRADAEVQIVNVRGIGYKLMV